MLYRCFRVGWWLLLVPTLLLARSPSPRADSLRRLLAAPAPADTTRVRRLLVLAEELAATDAPQAQTYTQQALALSQQLHDVPGEGRALLWLSTLARRQARYGPAQRYAQQAQQLYARTGNRRGQGRSYLQLMLIEMIQGNYAPALVAGQQGLPLAEQTHDRQTQRRLQATLGSIYLNLEDYSAALPTLLAALHNGEQAHDWQVVMTTVNALGTLYTNQKKWAAALHYYQRARQLAIQQHDQLNGIISEINLGDVNRLQGHYAQAKAYGQRARAQALASHDAYSLPFAELLLAQVYQGLHQSDSAIVLAQHSLALGQQTHSKENLRDASQVLAQAYADQRAFALAYRYQVLYKAYADTLTGEQTQRQTSALRYGYELDKKQAQIALLTKTRQLQAQRSARQRQQLVGLLAGLAGVVLLAGLLWRNVVLKQRANRRLNEKNQEIAGQRDALDRTLLALKATQGQLIQREKMASLGELTAGVAHELQNPLNFVTNFAGVSIELAGELAQEQATPTEDPMLAAELLQDLQDNLQKIDQHGQRAAGIVRGMLEHSRQSTGERQLTDLNALCDEYLRLAYQGLRTRDPAATIQLLPEYAPDLPLIEVVPPEIGRVLLNLLTNAFYAVRQRQLLGEPGYVPTVRLRTQLAGSQVELSVEDNGAGIPAALQAKVFQPFFTTKPPGEGIGLGLSLSYDIITTGHGGTLEVTSTAGQSTVFTLRLPLDGVGVPVAAAVA